MSSVAAIPDRVRVHHNKQDSLGDYIAHIEKLYDGDGTPLWIEHPSLGKQADLIALPLTQLNAVEFYPYDIADKPTDISIGVSDIVSVIGFPFGIKAGKNFGVWATGFIASEPHVDYDNLPQLLIDCRTRKGQSGSPVIAYRSGGATQMTNCNLYVGGGPLFRLIGIYSGRINKESDLGVVWKISAIRELVSKAEQIKSGLTSIIRSF